MSLNRWIELTERNPDHSSWYVERFRSMAAAGDDLGGRHASSATGSQWARCNHER
jgi:hypothetical protein